MLAPAAVGEGVARPDVSVVVTVFNEARNVDELVGRLASALTAWGRPWEVVLVDDGSSDGSRALLRAAHARDGRFRIVLLKRNVGQHPAMAAGMLHVARRHRGDDGRRPAERPRGHRQARRRRSRTRASRSPRVAARRGRTR